MKTSLQLIRAKNVSESPLVYRISNLSTNTYIPTGITLRPTQWNGTKIIRHKEADALMERATEIKEHYDAILAQLMKRRSLKDYRPSEIRMLLLAEENKEAEKTTACLVVDSARQYAADCKESTGRLYEYLAKTLEQYQPHVIFDDITATWLRTFDRWLAGRGMAVNSRGVLLRNLRALCNVAIDEGLTTVYGFRKFSIKIQETAKRAISASRLRSFFTDKLKDEVAEYRDMFKLIFLLHGINVIDLAALTEENIVNGRLHYYRSKTGHYYDILLFPESLELIRKYHGHRHLVNIAERRANYKDWMLTANKTLKRRYDGMTTYVMRHTFATIAQTDLHIPNELVAQMLGHSFGNRVTNTYIKPSQEQMDEAAAKVINYILYNKR